MPTAPMRMSVVQPQAFPRTVGRTTVVDCVRRLTLDPRFSAVEIASVVDGRARSELREHLIRTGTECVFLGGLSLLRSGTSLCASGPDREQAVALGRALIDEAHYLGATRILVTSGPDPGPSRRMHAAENLVQSLVELCLYATTGDKQLHVSLEPTDRHLDHRQLVGPTQQALDIVREVSRTSDNIELNLDLSHLIQLGEDPAASLTAASGICTHVHLANWIRTADDDPLHGDSHPPFGLESSEVGHDQLVGCLATMARAGYFGSDRHLVGVEVKPMHTDDPWQVLDNAVAAVQRAWSARRLSGAEPTDRGHTPPRRATVQTNDLKESPHRPET